LLGPMSAHKPDGRIVLSSARIAGLAVGEAAQTTWYPGSHPRRDIAKHLAADVTGQLGVDLLREFVLHRRGQ